MSPAAARSSRLFIDQTLPVYCIGCGASRNFCASESASAEKDVDSREAVETEAYRRGKGEAEDDPQISDPHLVSGPLSRLYVHDHPGEKERNAEERQRCESLDIYRWYVFKNFRQLANHPSGI